MVECTRLESEQTFTGLGSSNLPLSGSQRPRRLPGLFLRAIVSSMSSSQKIADAALLDQIVVVIGGTSGIGLETARSARAAGAQIVLTARSRERLDNVARELEAR